MSDSSPVPSSPPVPELVPVPAFSERDPQRVHWMELFFDLVFVAYIGQLAHGLHGEPGPVELLTFLVLFFPGWWAWVNIMLTVNILPGLSARGLGIAMFAGMLGVGLMAVAAEDGLGERAWAFALGNAALRMLLFALWWYRRRTAGGTQLWRIFVYNGVTAVLWLAAVFVPVPYAFGLWAAAIAIELALLARRRGGSTTVPEFSTAHLAERSGLFIIIVLGESVLTLVAQLSEGWGPEPAFAAFLGFVLIALIAWSFFIYGTGALEEGLARLQRRLDYRGLRDTVMLWPFVLVSGVVMLSGALAAAIHHPAAPLPLGAGAALGGGIALFYLTNAAISLRYGQPVRSVLRWAVPAIGASLGLIALTPHLPAMGSLAGAVSLLILIVSFVEVTVAKREAVVA